MDNTKLRLLLVDLIADSATVGAESVGNPGSAGARLTILLNKTLRELGLAEVKQKVKSD